MVGRAWSVLSALRRCIGEKDEAWELTGGGLLRETRRLDDEGMVVGWQVVIFRVRLKIRIIREQVLTWKKCMLPKRVED